jgi:hypothetical protein
MVSFSVLCQIMSYFDLHLKYWNETWSFPPCPEFSYLKSWMGCPNTTTAACWKNSFMLELYQHECLLSIAFTASCGQFCCLHNFYLRNSIVYPNTSIPQADVHWELTPVCAWNHCLNIYVFCLMHLLHPMVGFVVSAQFFTWTHCMVVVLVPCGCTLTVSCHLSKEFLLIPLFENRSHPDPRIHVVSFLRLLYVKIILVHLSSEVFAYHCTFNIFYNTKIRNIMVKCM